MSKEKTIIEPINDRILVRREEPEEKTQGGIILPKTAQEKPNIGIVIAVGPGRWHDGERIPVSLETGDRILFGKYSGTTVQYDGEELMILREDEVFAAFRVYKE